MNVSPVEERNQHIRGISHSERPESAHPGPVISLLDSWLIIILQYAMFDDQDDFFGDARSVLYTPPRKTADYTQLRFQLARFRVFRAVQLPLTFTFANLHGLIQYMFGWSDSHLHRSEVFPNVVLFDGDSEALVGTIKSCGRRRPLEDYELGDRPLETFRARKSAHLSCETQSHAQKRRIRWSHVDGGKEPHSREHLVTQ